MMAVDDSRAKTVADFWLGAGPGAWFEKNHAFDTDFRTRFLDLHYAAARRELDHWSAFAEGSFALMVLLDQFPRNCFRGTGHMFATDPLARLFAREAVAAGHDLKFEASSRVFFYLPFEHSENLADQELSLELHRSLSDDFQKYAIEHHEIIHRFGRFPHRNRALGRSTTEEEQAFLDGGGFAG
jgi:uncharacterized protein (DUF924 family)